MQLPLIIIEVELQDPGSQTLYATELKPGVDAQKLVSIMRQFLWSIRANSKEKLPSREKIAALCKLASTEADRMLIKMSVCSCLSGKEAQKRYGVQSLSAKQRKIDDALEKASEIRDTILELANVKEKAVLQTLGYDFTSSDLEDEESNLEEIEGVEWISSSEDEAEFPCSILAGSEVDCCKCRTMWCNCIGWKPGFCYNFRET